MRNKTNTILFILLYYLLFAVSSSVFAGNQEVNEVRAIQLFNAGNFAEAEKSFAKLIRVSPDDPLLNYYYGASRTENGHFGENELDYLNYAGGKIIPDRLHYYLGIQHHARGNWKQALRYYNQFRLSVPENEQKELELEKKIQQCFNLVNPYEALLVSTENNSVPVVTLQPEPVSEVEKKNNVLPSADISENEKYGQQISDILAIAEIPEKLISDEVTRLPDLPVVPATYSLPPGDIINFQINNVITYAHSSQFHTEEGKKLFENGNLLQHEQQMQLTETDILRQRYIHTNDSEEQKNLAAKILSLEMDSYQLQEKIKEHFVASRKLENEYWENAGSSARSVFLTEQEKIIEVLQLLADEINSHTENEITDYAEPDEDHTEESYEYTPSVPSDEETGELAYKIQLGAYSKGIPTYRQRLFNKLAVIRIIENYTDEKGVVVYTTGNLKNYDDALKMQNQVRQEGIQDAQVVPYFNGKRITLEQAKNIEAKNDF